MTSDCQTQPTPWRTALTPAIVWLIGTLVVLFILAPMAWVTFIMDGGAALLVILAAVGWGCWPSAWLKVDRGSWLRQFCVASALGLGITGTFTLILGMVGVLSSVTAWILLAVGGVLGLIRLQSFSRTQKQIVDDATPRTRQLAIIAIGCLILAVPAGVMFLGDSLPPGLIWDGEGNGYDVLEYHLQAQREYYEAGQIQFLEHNVYASFPQQVEIHSLLLMHMFDDPYAAAIPAQYFHGLLGILTILTLVAWMPTWWSKLLVALLAGTVPWLAYLGAIAYVELGMLFFAAVSALILFESLGSGLCWRSVFAAGLCAGLAAGCKYTAILFVIGGLALALLITVKVGLKSRLGHVAIFGLSSVVAFSPWLIRNVVFTGNPVYPFAYHVFGGSGWSGDQADQWNKAHAFHETDRFLGGRGEALVREFLGYDANQSRPNMFGFALPIFAVLGIMLRRDRQTAFLGVWAILILALWLTATYLAGRFLVPIVVPLAVLGAMSVVKRGDVASKTADLHRRPRSVIVILVVFASAANCSTIWSLLRAERDNFSRQVGGQLSLASLVGGTQVFKDEFMALNQKTLDGRSLWLIGDAAVFYINSPVHYSVIFSRDPWLEFIEKENPTPQETICWLRSRNVSHVVFSWTEIRRLRQTYGFSDVVTPEWVATLERAGLRRIDIDGVRAGEAVYEIPHN